MTKKTLRVATEEDAPPAVMSVSDAVLLGSRMDQLVAMRRIAAEAIDSPATSPRDLKALMISVNDFSKEIEELRALEAEQVRDAEVHSGSVSTAWRPEAI